MDYSHKNKESNEVLTLILGTKKILLNISVREGLSFTAIAKTEDIGEEWKELKKNWIYDLIAAI